MKRSLQDLIAAEQHLGSKEAEHTAEITVRISAYGYLHQLWQSVLEAKRILEVKGFEVKFYLGQTELTDDKSKP